jgi:hypothetical protein
MEVYIRIIYIFSVNGRIDDYREKWLAYLNRRDSSLQKLSVVWAFHTQKKFFTDNSEED